jgi:peptidoglycan/xylan/chitin deacetylase (PgdA/CDA1 family)
MYHHINPHQGDMVTVTPGVFEDQMKYIRDSGYRTLSIDEFVLYLSGSLTVEEKAVVVTFDDGWLDNYIYALPVIKKYHIKAAIFVVTDRVERASEGVTALSLPIPTHGESKELIKRGKEEQVTLTWGLMHEMAETGLVEFYSHTRSHRKCDRLSKEELIPELEESKKVIEERLRRPCPYLCWPYGKYGSTAAEVAKEAGYKALFTTSHGVMVPGSDPFAIKRIVVKDKRGWFKRRMVIYTNPLLSRTYLAIKKR